ncbi:MAG: hypothetical protein HQL94_07460 [Magnetococcales bacterium]|nr:hypothetical protein [Magnetococcales bacterium]
MDERQAAIQAEAMLDLVEERLVTKKDLAEQDLRLAAIEAGLTRHQGTGCQAGLCGSQPPQRDGHSGCQS